MDEKGSIHLADGRVLPANFRHFAHGYTVTAHRSQGKSVDSVIISGDGMQKDSPSIRRFSRLSAMGAFVQNS